jgi:hypothetical protein
MNAGLVIIMCGCRSGLVSGCGKTVLEGRDATASLPSFSFCVLHLCKHVTGVRRHGALFSERLDGVCLRSMPLYIAL